MKKNISGLSVLGISLLAVGIITFSAMNASPASAAEIAEKAIEKTQHMSAEEIANINNQYKQDLKGRLSEAKHDEDLRVLPASELQSWGWATAKEDPSVKTYLTYTNANSDRIVIGLDSNSEPVFVMNFDNRSESPSNAPTNEDSGTPPPSR